MMIQCTTCGQFKSETEFWKGSGNRCSTCEYKRHRNYIKRNPDVKRKSTIKPIAEDLGITPDELLDIYNVMFQSQNGRCKICGIHASELGKALDIDHCHSTKVIRGLLCNKCNRGISCFSDDIDVCQSAIEYLSASQHPSS